MNRQGITAWIAASVVAAAGGIATAAMTGLPETWEGGATAGWTRQDPLNATSLPVGNPTNYLEVVFGQQAQSFPEVNIIKADVSASGGAFSGDWWTTAVTNIGFRLYCSTLLPGSLHLCFYSTVSSNWWYYPIGAPVVGAWKTYNVALDFSAGWWNGLGANAVQFRKDRESVGWVGVRVQRNSSLEAQSYGLDDFVLLGASRLKDSDSDGASDWNEFMAGTDAGNASSRLVLEINEAKADNTDSVGVVLRWTSGEGRTYSIHRSADLMDGFSTLESGIPATPPVNEHNDMTATNRGPYFYRIFVE